MTIKEERLLHVEHLRTVCGISAGMKAREFFSLLKQAEVTLLVDTRSGRSYQQARFSHEKDIGYLCECHNIKYQVVDDLMPTKEMRQRFHEAFDHSQDKERDPLAWTHFLQYYALGLFENQFLSDGKSTRKIVDNDDQVVAFMCACQHHMDCHRQVLLGMLGNFIQGITVKHLSPEMVGGVKPKRKSPRRYLLEAIPQAMLDVDLPRQGVK